MSSDNIDRTVITTEQQSNRSWWDALASRFTQNVETRSRSPSIGVRRSGIDRIKPAKRLDEYRKIPEETPIVLKALTDFASDVVEPGYRIETDDDAVQEYLEEEWCPQAAILAGEKHNDLLPFLRLYTYERWRGGDALAEHVRADPESPNSPLTGVHLLNPEEIEFITYEEKNILVDPEAVGDVDAPRTKRGEDAAYVQYGKGAIVSSERDAIPLSQNDVTRSALNPGAGEIRGSPVTASIAKDVAAYQNIKRDMEKAIGTKAWGLWQVSFGHDTFEYTDTDPETGENIEITEVLSWAEEEMSEYAEEHLEDIEPGAFLVHDGVIDLNRLDGEVPDLIDEFSHYVSNIVSPLPTPLFMVGWETDINQFVTERQDHRYQQLVNEEREELERVFTDLMERVVEQNLVENSHSDISVSEVPSDLRFKLEPPESDSPVMSLDADAIDRMHTWTQAFKEARGDMPAEMVVNPETIRELILQLPEDAAPDMEDATVDESDPDVQEQVNILDDMMNGDGEGSDVDLEPPGINPND